MIIIDHGRIFFDGPLSAIIDRFATHKELSFTLEGDHASDFAQFGEVVERSPGSVRLRVPRAKVSEICREVLTSFQVSDLSVNELPVEEVIRMLFGERRDILADEQQATATVSSPA